MKTNQTLFDLSKEEKEIDILNQEATEHIIRGRLLNEKARKTVARTKILFNI